MHHPVFRPHWSAFLLAAILTVLAVPSLSAGASTEKFPLFPCIQPNVRFWEAVYSHYTTHQGIIHDSADLRRIYGVIPLLDSQIPGAAAINDARKTQATDRIRAVLEQLAAGRPARTAEERRIASLFLTHRTADYREAAERIRMQLGQSDRFHAGFLRSGRYLPQFRQIFISRGLPPELVYLPHVESSFNPKAYSKAGASGLWQFTLATGKDFMTINELVDERRDPYLATLAAAELLKENYRQLGDWPLAITAYNYGRQGMKRAQQAKGGYENIFRTYNEGYFKFASRNFYSEFLAAMRVAQRLERNPHIVCDPPEWTTSFRLKQATPISQVRAASNLSTADFLRLNPALLDPVTSGQQPAPAGYQVRIPAKEQRQRLETPQARIVHPLPTQPQRLAPQRQAPTKVVPKAVRSPAKTGNQAGFRTYTVKKGDTIASIARRFGLSPREILAANPRPGSRLPQAGDTLRIPASR